MKPMTDMQMTRLQEDGQCDVLEGQTLGDLLRGLRVLGISERDVIIEVNNVPYGAFQTSGLPVRPRVYLQVLA